MGTDVDDVTGARVISRAAVHDRCNLLAFGINTDYGSLNAPRAIDGFFKTDGVPDMPIAVPKTSYRPSGADPVYQATMKNRTAGLWDPSRVYEDAVTVYRRVLANATRLVDFLAIGYLNNLQELLQSPADGISSLTGLELVTAKVRQLFIMGGQFPSGTSNNFDRDATAIASAQYVTGNWPTQIVYSGHEMGTGILTGGNLNGQASTDLLAQALVDYGVNSTGRDSWDPMCAMLAVDGVTSDSGYRFVRGSCTVAGDGSNTWTDNPAGKDLYAIKTQANSYYQNRINRYIDKANW